jgi:zinc transport system ATP-binding protein
VNEDASQDTVLDVRNLTIRFGRTTVISNLSFSVQRASTLAIIGPNGSGKTVLLRALVGAIPSEGEIRWIAGTRIGYVPQKLDIERDIPVSGLDFLHARIALPGNNKAEIDSVLERVGVTREIAAKPLGVLSGGQFQRLLVAFALLGSPSVLLLDEPTAGVDEPGQEQLHSLVQRLQTEEELTVLFISHELSVVYKYATDVLCLGHKKARKGPPRQILTPAMLEDLYGTPVDFHVHDD